MFDASFEFMYFGRHPSIEIAAAYPVSSTGGTPVYEPTLSDDEYGFRYYDAPGVSDEGGLISSELFGFMPDGSRFTPALGVEPSADAAMGAYQAGATRCRRK